MNNAIEFFSEVENKLPVENIKYDDICAWQFLRQSYREKYTNTSISSSNINKNKFKIFKNIYLIISIFKKSFRGFFNYYKQKKYILFTSQINEKVIEGKISDKFSHHLIKYLKDELLIFQIPSSGSKIKKKSDYYYSACVSSWTMYLRCLPEIVYNLLPFSKFKLQGQNILNEIEKKLNIKVNYKFKTVLFFAFYRRFLKYFKKNKNLKCIFIECYMGIIHQSAIYAAKKCGIISIELQHGIISKAHLGYIVPQKIGRDSFPDYLFTFGDYVKDVLKNSFINNKNIIPTGSYYLEYLGNNKNIFNNSYDYCNSLHKSYQKLVAVTGQVTIDRQLLEIIRVAALTLPEIVFLYIPRKYNEHYKALKLPQNMIICENFGFYELIQFCDLHATVYSTCALESVFFGIPNILYNLNNLSRYYYQEILDNENYTRYCDDMQSFIDTVNNWNLPSKEEVKSYSIKFYEPESEKKLVNSLKTILNHT